ncbi:DUF4190 domain-containing protein [Kocuria massiliensis]|uniref:DUF4190 domain-containing protein n=1 Tax=Kocuria massiliensis TaxID=1926282 RepID=UPI0022B948E9|nr:DUF4190 domain-containing protein [Kocuria massiliensis]
MSMYPQEPHQGQPPQQPPHYAHNNLQNSYYAQQQTPYGQPPANPRTNALAIVGFILGVLGMIFWWIPIVGFVFGVAGVVLSIIALRQRELRGLSIAGICLAGVGVTLAALWFFLLFIGSMSHNSSASYNAAATSISTSMTAETSSIQ